MCGVMEVTNAEQLQFNGIPFQVDKRNRHQVCRIGSTVIAPYKGRLELWYIENRNMWLDLILISLTAVAVI